MLQAKPAMKTTKSIKTIGAFINHEKAIFYNPQDEAQAISKLDSGIESRPRYAGEGSDQVLLGHNRSTNFERNKHNREQNALHHYLTMLCAMLQPYDRAIILGPGILVHQLKNFLEDDKHFAGRDFVFREHDKMTENEFRAEVKGFVKG